MNIGKYIQAQRSKKGLTQKQVAQNVYVAVVTVKKWENGTNEPNLEMLDKLSHLFGCTMDELIYGYFVGYESGEEMIGELELEITTSEKVFLEESTKPENIQYEKGVLDGLKKALDLLYEVQR